jgi:hypothetical protein
MTENRYYRYLKLPFEFNLTVPEFKEQEKHKILTAQQIPRELISFVQNHDCRIHFAEMFRKRPEDVRDGKWCSIHVDGLELDDHVKINYVIGVGDSKMCWWRTRSGIEPRRGVTVVGTDFLRSAEQDCDLLCSAKLDRPALVNVGQLHNVVDVTEPRYAFTFMLHKASGSRLVWDEAVTIFKDYLE